MTTPAQRDVLGAHWRARLLHLLSDAASGIVDNHSSIGERVHQVRRRTKEGRALLKLAPPPFADAARLRRDDLRALRQSFGPARDARVALELIDGHKLRSAKARVAAGLLHRKLATVCVLEEAALTPRKLEQTAAQFKAVAEAVAGWRLPPEADPRLLDDIAKAYGKARRLTPDADDVETVALHAFRSAVVDHVYQLALFGDDNRKIARRAKSLRKLREELGEYLDRLRLKEAASEMAGAAHELAPRIGRKRLARALAAARRLFDDKPSVFRAKLGD